MSKMPPEVAKRIKENRLGPNHLDNIRYRINIPNLLLFARIAYDANYPEWKKYLIRAGADIIQLIKGKKDLPETMSVDRMFRIAKLMRIEPELLVDEDWYVPRRLMASYRIAFIAFRKGLTLTDLMYKDCPHKDKESFRKACAAFFNGRWHATNMAWIAPILKQIEDRLDIPVSMLAMRPYRSSAIGNHGLLIDAVLPLDKHDMVALASIAKAITEYKTHSHDDKLIDDVNKLLGWYLRGKEKESGGNITSSSGADSN